MPTLISFRRCPSGGRETAFLGEVEIGYVRPADPARRQRAGWLCVLPPSTFCDWKAAPNLSLARRALLLRIADWMECATLERPADDLRQQAYAIERAA